MIIKNEIYSGGELVDVEEIEVPDETPVPDPIAIAAEAIRDEITIRLQPSAVNSIAEVKAAVIQGLDAAVMRLSQ